ncbi:hypothetical protein ACFX1R_049247 [Malus domestica]
MYLGRQHQDQQLPYHLSHSSTTISHNSSHTSMSRLPRFWQEAFEAAFEHLSSDVAAVRGAAISKITKMSICSIVLDPISLQSTDFALAQLVVIDGGE